MGLSVSHDCWQSSYSTFTEWRRLLALAAGMPPLDMMEGYFYDYQHGDKGYVAEKSWYVSIGSERVPASISESLSPRMRQAVRALPIAWKYFEKDPLSILLAHSDSGGIIEHKDCAPLAKRLLEIAGSIAPEPEPGHPWGVDWARRRAEEFAAGLMRAHEAGEDVEFH